MIFGWEIFSVRQLKQNESFKLRQDGGNRAQTEEETQFLKSMVRCKSEALVDKSHCEKL